MSILYESYNTGDDTEAPLYGATDAWRYQTFTATANYLISSIKLKMWRVLLPGTVTVSIRAVSANKPTGIDLAVGTIDGDTFQISSAAAIFEEIALTSYALTNGTEYAIVVRALDGDASNYVNWRLLESTGAYADGNAGFSTDGGSSWSAQTANDFMFEVYGGGKIPVDKAYSKELVAVANNQVWHESALGTKAEITAVTSVIDTGNSLDAVAGMQKVFIANTSVLGILDFANVKLPTGEIGTSSLSAPLRSLVLTGGTSSAKIVSDFCPVATGSAYVYGYPINTEVFISGETVTGGASGSVSFALVSAQVAASTPHWYNWTPQHNDTTTYGFMPDSAKLACLYNGRVVLAGNPDYPHMWYMSRVLDPFDWKYTVNDPLTAIRGGNADAGEIGDIIKALIEYRDDYFFMGCANSWHVIAGDPASGGSRNLLTNKTGIFGARAWCFDDANNLYFWGRNGLYQIPVGAGITPPKNISELALPEWVQDWNLDESTHRIVLTFDPYRKGIIVSKTTLAGGDNLNYWYDFKTQGFFPETYPDNCGVYCSHFYNATDGDYRKLLLGGADGYIREFSDSTKDDVTSASTAVAIESHVVCPIIPISEPDKRGRIDSIVVVNAGGASSGVFGDSDGVDLKFYTGDSAEETLEDIMDGASAVLSCTITAIGRSNKIRARMRGTYLGVKASNTAVGESWAVERIWGDNRPAGKG